MKKATTVRLQENVQEALDRLSTIERRPKNKMVNEAVAEYVARKTEALHRSTGDILSRLSSDRRRDPDFEDAIEAFAEAEVAVRKDPAEGRVSTQSTGPVTAGVRRLLDA